MIGVISSLVKPRESDQKKRGTTEDNASDRRRRQREERTDSTPAGVDSHVYSRSNTASGSPYVPMLIAVV
jgi:hypothetical protein